jgi:hypothetical protein
MHIKLLLNLVFNLFLISPMMASHKVSIPEDQESQSCKIPIPQSQAAHQKTSKNSCSSFLPPTIAIFTILLMTQMLVYSSPNRHFAADTLSPESELQRRVQACPKKIKDMPYCSPAMEQEISDAFQNRAKKEGQDAPKKICCGKVCFLQFQNCKTIHSLL